MTLREYLKAEGLTLAEFAARLDRHPVTVHEWVTGKAIPRRENLQLIHAATGGRVLPSSFMPEPVDAAQ